MASKEESFKVIVDYEALGAAGVLEKFISPCHGCWFSLSSVFG